MIGMQMRIEEQEDVLRCHTTVMNTHTAASAAIERNNKGEKMKLNDIFASAKVTFLYRWT